MKHAEAGQGTISGTPVNYAKIHNWLVKQEVPVCISFSVCTLHSLPFIPSKLNFNHFGSIVFMEVDVCRLENPLSGENQTAWGEGTKDIRFSVNRLIFIQES